MTPPEKGKSSEKIYVQTISCASLDKSKAEKIIDKGIKKAFFENLESKIQTLPEIQRDGIKLPYQINNKVVYAKKIRIAAHINNPIPLKIHKDISTKEYKQKYYVANDENYLLAVYRGINTKGKVESSFKVLNLLNATKSKQHKEILYSKYDESNGIKLNLYKTFTIGQIVILKETEDEDVFALPIEKLRNRIYSVVGLSSSGKQFFIKLTHLTISVPWSYMSASNFDNIQNFRRYEPQKLCCLTENTDFKITPAGEIVKL